MTNDIVQRLRELGVTDTIIELSVADVVQERIEALEAEVAQLKGEVQRLNGLLLAPIRAALGVKL
jgi:polyhydroxyalkanoate synthesis regulator phasin